MRGRVPLHVGHQPGLDQLLRAPVGQVEHLVAADPADFVEKFAICSHQHLENLFALQIAGGTHAARGFCQVSDQTLPKSP